MVGTLALALVVLQGWDERLAGPEADEARQELVALGRRAGSILSELVESGTEKGAWGAFLVFRELGEDGKGAGRSLMQVASDPGAEPWRRGVATLCAGAPGEDASGAVKSLIDLLEERPPPEVSVPARLALVNIGVAAVKPAAKLMSHEDPIVAQWGAQVLFALGEEARTARKEMAKVLDEDEGYFLYGIVHAALSRCGPECERALAKVWDARAPLLEQQKGGGMIEYAVYEDSRKLIEMVRSIAGSQVEPVHPLESLPAPGDSIALPKGFEDYNGDGLATLGELVLTWGSHLATELATLHGSAYVAPPARDYIAWRANLLPVVRSSRALEVLSPPRGE